MREIFDAAQGFGIAVAFREDYASLERIDQAALAGNAELRGQISMDMGDDVHVQRLAKGRSFGKYACASPCAGVIFKKRSLRPEGI